MSSPSAPTARVDTFILASASPRRRALLVEVGLKFEVLAPEVDESTRRGEPADVYVLRLAREKAASIAARAPGRVVLAADTTVVLGDEILGKPRDAAEAREMLEKLSDRSHAVLTAVVVDGPHQGYALVRSEVRFRELSAELIAWYIGTGEPMDKAGAYAVQGKAAQFVKALYGSPTNVIGLPMAEALELLANAGVKLPW